MPNISLTKHQEQFIQKKVKSGQYLSASELVREALRLLENAERVRDALRSDIAVATRQIKAGKVVDGTTAFQKARAHTKAIRCVVNLRPVRVRVL